LLYNFICCSLGDNTKICFCVRAESSNWFGLKYREDLRTLLFLGSVFCCLKSHVMVSFYWNRFCRTSFFFNTNIFIQNRQEKVSCKSCAQHKKSTAAGFFPSRLTPFRKKFVKPFFSSSTRRKKQDGFFLNPLHSTHILQNFSPLVPCLLTLRQFFLIVGDILPVLRFCGPQNSH